MSPNARRLRSGALLCVAVAWCQSDASASWVLPCLPRPDASGTAPQRSSSPVRRRAGPGELPGLDISTGDLALGGLLLAFCAAYLPEALGFNGAAYKVGGFRYFINRGHEAFSEAVHQLAVEYPGYKDDTIFTYFDTFEETLPQLGSAKRHVRLLDREVTNIYDHKRGLEERLRASGCNGPDGPFPETYFSAEEALEATSSSSDALFFAKLPGETGGRGLRVLRREELQQFTNSDYVFQRAVQDLELIDGRKFVLRYFFLIYDGSLYLHHRAVVIVHGLPYEPQSVDAGVQFRHNWYEVDAADGAYLMTMHKCPQAPRWRAALARRLAQLAPALQPLLAATAKQHGTATRYVLVGGDAVIEGNGDAKLIEFNMYPNLHAENDLADKDVYVPLLSDALALMLVGQQRPNLQEVIGLEKEKL
ncbi:unnamed protein product [Durusdinium trenchii]|uniref:Tubulin--tyrosine ligase-like protein 9 n=1 Tax=Durusdinium trenchii TaxID=1381693 RepID=A0ABP0SLT1_9DINO